jgi:hypothetical protein
MRGRRRRGWFALLTLGAALRVGAAGAEVVELIPTERSAWGATNLFAPVTGLFLGGPGYWYSARRIEVDTTPPGAVLDLFYVRGNFQKGYEQSEAPATLVLPSRVEAGPRDSVTIRALLDGYRQGEAHVLVRSRENKVHIELEPLANQLVAMTHGYFAGRTTLNFVTKESLTFRIQQAADGFTVVLTSTGMKAGSEGTLEGVQSSLLKSVKAQQLGEDLVVRVALTEQARARKVETRSRQSFDPVRGLYTFALDVIAPGEDGATPVQRAQAALREIQPGAVTGCAGEFDAALHEQLDPSALARALTPSGGFADPYLRAALKRLGELSPGGELALADGTRFRASVPIELSAAAAQAAEVKGYLAMLREFVARLEPPSDRRESLRGLIAPELGVASFGAVMDAAEERERTCLARAG